MIGFVQHVKFTVGFSLRGVRVIDAESISRSVTTKKDVFAFYSSQPYNSSYTYCYMLELSVLCYTNIHGLPLSSFIYKFYHFFINKKVIFECFKAPGIDSSL